LVHLQLKEETAPVASIDKEFALFRESERERTEKMLRQARALKMFAAALAVAVFALAIVGAFLFFKNYKKPAQPALKSDHLPFATAGATCARFQRRRFLCLLCALLLNIPHFLRLTDLVETRKIAPVSQRQPGYGKFAFMKWVMNRSGGEHRPWTV